jgi:glucose 1-dehydrogenase
MKGLAGQVAVTRGGSAIGQALAVRLGEERVDVASDYVGLPGGASSAPAAG